MTINQKRSVEKWFRKNVVLLFLIALVVISMSLGAAGYALFANIHATDEPVARITDEMAICVEETNAMPVNDSDDVFYHDVPLSEELQDYIRRQCNEFDVPEELVFAMIEVESSFQSDAVSKSKDYGLMQINECNHKWLTEKLGVVDFLDPYQNVLCGVYLISEHLDETDGDIVKALMRYNCGATGAWKLWQKGIYSTEYTNEIVSAFENYKKENRPDGATS